MASEVDVCVLDFQEEGAEGVRFLECGGESVVARFFEKFEKLFDVIEVFTEIVLVVFSELLGDFWVDDGVVEIWFVDLVVEEFFDVSSCFALGVSSQKGHGDVLVGFVELVDAGEDAALSAGFGVEGGAHAVGVDPPAC